MRLCSALFSNRNRKKEKEPLWALTSRIIFVKRSEMISDNKMTPGAVAYWEHFYDSADDGVLVEKSRRFRRLLDKRESAGNFLRDGEEDHHCKNKRTERRTADKEREKGAPTGGDDDGAALLTHYEWFMTYEACRNELLTACRSAGLFNSPSPRRDGELRVLHVGCGNSNLCEDFSADAIQELSLTSENPEYHGNAKRKKKRSSHKTENTALTGELDGSGISLETSVSCQHQLSPANPHHKLDDDDDGHGLMMRCCSTSANSHSLGVTSKAGVVTVLNIDICASLMRRLSRLFPRRLYCVGDCCDMALLDSDSPSAASSSPSAWFAAMSNSSKTGVGVASRAVDCVIDKGTLDALLSAFPGEENPNAASYLTEALRVLRSGGLLLLVSINSLSVVVPYVYSASVTGASFRLAHQSTVDVSKNCDDGAARRGGRRAASVEDPTVETLGSHYNIFGFVSVEGGQ
jgi:hypothetical protein